MSFKKKSCEITFDSLYRLTSDDMNLVISDSIAYREKLIAFLSLLKLDQVTNLSWIRIIDDNKFQTVTSNINVNASLNYSHSGLWQYDKVTVSYTSDSEGVIDYYTLNPNNTYALENKHLLSIYNCKHFQNIYDYFSFEIGRDFYNSLDTKSKITLRKRLDSVISLMYQSIFLEKTFEVKELNATFYKDSFGEIETEIINTYNLTPLNLSYLKLIATGNTAKEIALQLNKSSRSIETTMMTLCKKLKCSNKQQLVLVAKIIVSYLYY